MSDRHEIWNVADALQMDLRAASAKLVQLRGMLAGLDLPDAPSVECRHCGLECRGTKTLAEHMYQSHDGPLPEHWASLDERVIEPVEDEDEEDAA